MGAELTGGQQRFALEYAKDGNGAAAARRAGYSAKGAKQQASHLLTIPNVRAAVSAAVERHFADLNLDLARIIREAARVGISDIGNLFDADGHVIPTHRLPHDIRKAIASIKVQHIKVDVEVQEGDERTTTTTTTTQTTEFKFWDKLKGLELVGKLKGFMKPQLELDAGDTWLKVLERMTAAQMATKANGNGKAAPPPRSRRRHRPQGAPREPGMTKSLGGARPDH